MTAVTEGLEADAARLKRVMRRKRFLMIAVVALVGVAVVLGALVWSDRGTGSVLPAEAQKVLDDYINAATNQDPDAWRETVTDDYFNRRYMFGDRTHELWTDSIMEEDWSAPYANRIEFGLAVDYEQRGDPVVTGDSDGPWFVSIPQSWPEVLGVDNPNPVVWDGNATYVIVERDGTMKVASEYWTGTLTLQEN